MIINIYIYIYIYKRCIKLENLHLKQSEALSSHQLVKPTQPNNLAQKQPNMVDKKLKIAGVRQKKLITTTKITIKRTFTSSNQRHHPLTKTYTT